MVWKDKAYTRFYWRMYRRERHHPGFRQAYIDNGGMCQAILNDNDICGCIDSLELHAPNGEHNDNGVIVRTTLCSYCHTYVDDEAHRHSCQRIGTNGIFSWLAEDIAYEQYLEGGLEHWLVKFNLINRYQPTTVQINKER